MNDKTIPKHKANKSYVIIRKNIHELMKHMDSYLIASKYISGKCMIMKKTTPFPETVFEKYIIKFQDNNSPARIKHIPDSRVIDLLFNIENRQSLIAELGTNTIGDISNELGDIFLSKKSDWPFRKTDNEVGIGKGITNYSYKTVSLVKAEEIALQIRDNLCKCIEYLYNHELATLNDYIAFEKVLKSYLGLLYKQAWIHKYLYLLFPKLFTQFHSYDQRTSLLKMLGINHNIDSIFESDFHLVQICQHAHISSQFKFAHIIYRIPELFENIAYKEPRLVVVKSGTYGNWTINKADEAFLMWNKNMIDCSTLIPKEIASVFSEAAYPQSRSIRIVCKGTYYSLELSETNNQLYISFSDEFSSFLESEAKSRESEFVIYFQRMRANYYTFSLITIGNPTISCPDTYEEQIKHATSLTSSQLASIIAKREEIGVYKKTISTEQILIDPYLEEMCKRAANGYCQLCERTAPFTDRKGLPYLECRFIIPISEGGESKLKNITALCPNCNKKLAVINDPDDISHLLKKAKK